MITITSLFAGLIFGLGLIISGMTDPVKVIGFLDVTGQWNYSLAFVMLGAISVSFFAFRIAKSKSKTVFGQPILISSNKEIDTRLVIGSICFGVGWGLAGYCPGPAIASIVTGIKPIIFVASMLLGMAVYQVLQKYHLAKDSQSS